jgi:metal-responsive CopG/Arc/MetJ family transcriptional regulator
MQRVTVTLDDDLLATLDDLSQRRGYHNRSKRCGIFCAMRSPNKPHASRTRGLCGAVICV